MRSRACTYRSAHFPPSRALPFLPFTSAWILTARYSIYKAHDDAKDKDFELELSWIGPDGRHTAVPASLRDEAVRKALQSLEEDMED